MRQRWLENPDPQFWVEVIKKLDQSDFCAGDNDRGWVANFDFLLKPETATKVTEGCYDRKSKKSEPKLFVEL